MTTFSYNSQEIIPAPFMAIEKAFTRTPDGNHIGSVFHGTITGTLVSFKGSPNSNQVFWNQPGYPPDEVLAANAQLAALLRKQEALKLLFAIDGQSLEIGPDNGSPSFKCNPIITGVSFAEDLWLFQCKYTITFEVSVVYINGTASGEDNFTQYISDASESWAIETESEAESDDPNYQHVYRITHNISATGKRFYDSNGIITEDAWKQAKDWVTPKLGYNATFVANSSLNISGYSPYNFVRSENIGTYDGQYSVSETWILTRGIAIEEFNVDTKSSIDTGLTNVSINGTITGLELRSANLTEVTTKYQNAATQFTTVLGSILSRAQLYSGKTLNIIALSSSVAHNPVNGIITYAYEFDNRPSNLIPGSLSEAITVSDNLNTDVIAIVPVLGRKIGPVLQNIGTSRERTRTLNIELVMSHTTLTSVSDMLNANPFLFGAASAAIASIVNSVNPATSFSASQSYLVENNCNWEPKTSRGSANATWVYEI